MMSARVSFPVGVSDVSGQEVVLIILYCMWRENEPMLGEIVCPIC